MSAQENTRDLPHLKPLKYWLEKYQDFSVTGHQMRIVNCYGRLVYSLGDDITIRFRRVDRGEPCGVLRTENTVHILYEDVSLLNRPRLPDQAILRTENISRLDNQSEIPSSEVQIWTASVRETQQGIVITHEELECSPNTVF